MDKFTELREKYDTFIYHSYTITDEGFSFRFSIGEFEFTPGWKWNGLKIPDDMDRGLIEYVIFSLGMTELVSYWKCACPPKVRVECGTLDGSQIAFWKKIYFNGLGEFFYTNGIHTTIEDFMVVENGNNPSAAAVPSLEGRGTSSGCISEEPGHVLEGSNHPVNVCRNGGVCTAFSNFQFSTEYYLVPIGGGKDSVVTLKILKGVGIPLIMNPRGATIGCIEAAGLTMDDVVVIRRSIDPLLLDLNSRGYLNGHTPFSAMLAFYTLLAAQLCGVANIALSNEGSANEDTIVGMGVNHQYSKSLEFENDFRAYVRQHLSPAYNYFSLLRPLSELQIAMLFSRLDEYHEVFRSCNAGSKQDIWCGHCAKCLFAYIILSPFIAPHRLQRIFGKDMLDDATMLHEFHQLTGQAETKPFECVGTVSEVNTAIAMTLGRWYANPHTRPRLLEGFSPRLPYTPLDSLGTDHNVPAPLFEQLSEWVHTLAHFMGSEVKL